MMVRPTKVDERMSSSWAPVGLDRWAGLNQVGIAAEAVLQGVISPRSDYLIIAGGG